jgi:hypothetical protein
LLHANDQKLSKLYLQRNAVYDRCVQYEFKKHSREPLKECKKRKREREREREREWFHLDEQLQSDKDSAISKSAIPMNPLVDLGIPLSSLLL